MARRQNAVDRSGCALTSADCLRSGRSHRRLARLLGLICAGLSHPRTSQRRVADVQKNPDRQSRRDRVPGDPHRARRWGSRRSRSIRTPMRARRMCRWPTRRCISGPRRRPNRYLLADKIIAACKADRRRGGASGLWLPVRADQLRAGARRRRHRLHRPAAERDRGDGRQDRIEEARQGGGGQRRPRLSSARSPTPTRRCGSRPRSAIR